jgi:NAD(P)-dependent dehydrogenase (short-subunit alcohol dehydrogenase family)
MRTADLADSARLATLGLVAWDAPGAIDMLVNNTAPKRKAVTALDPDDAETAMRVNFYDGSKASAVEVSDGIIAAPDTDTFEHYIPDIEAVVHIKTSDTDTYVPGAAEMTGP